MSAATSNAASWRRRGLRKASRSDRSARPERAAAIRRERRLACAAREMQRGSAAMKAAPVIGRRAKSSGGGVTGQSNVLIRKRQAEKLFAAREARAWRRRQPASRRRAPQTYLSAGRLTPSSKSRNEKIMCENERKRGAEI